MNFSLGPYDVELKGPVQNKKSMCFGHRLHKKYDWIFLVEKFIYMIKTCFQLKPRVLFMFLLVFLSC